MAKTDIRKYAVEMATRIMGVGTPCKDLVAKAKEIEAYIVGDAIVEEAKK